MRTDSNYKHLQNKLLFGVDWYLSMLTGAPEYKEFAELFFDTMQECDKWQWYRSSLVNSARFYGLDNSAIIKNMNNAIYDTLTKDTEIVKHSQNYKQIKKLKEQVDRLRKDMEVSQQENKK
jgi:hypothetical protein